MGYTHSFEIVNKSRISVDFEKLKKEIDVVLDEHKNIIQFEYDEKKPPLSEIDGTGYTVRFNGIEENGHETFYFNSNESYNFCKTARKDYDIVVCKVLLILKAFYKDSFEFRSDGFSNSQPETKKYKIGNKVNYADLDGCWADALRWFKKELVNCVDFRFRVDDVYGKDGCYFSYRLEEIK